MAIGRRTLALSGAAAGFVARPARASGGIAAPTKPWDATDFDYAVDGRVFPGIAIRLPGPDGAPGGLFTACRICTHQACVFGFETNYQLVGDIVGQALPNPVLFCRCHFSVYDPAQQGRVLHGPAPRPPWLFTAEEKDGALTVTSLEKGAGEVG